MSIIKDLRLFITYRNIIRKNRVILKSDYNIRLDNADRLYTVINIPQNLVEEPYNLRKADVDLIAEKFIREYVNKLSEYLNSIGLAELYDFYEPIKKVDKYSYLIIIGFKPLDSVEINRIFFRIFLPTFIGLSLIYFLVRLIFY